MSKATPTGPAANGNDRRKLTAAQRRARVVELRMAGHTWQTIADQVGYANKGTAYKAWQQALREITREPAEELRQLELDRLDRMLAAVWPNAINPTIGDLQYRAIDRVLAIETARNRLLGLAAPTRIMVEEDIEVRLTFEGHEQ